MLRRIVCKNPSMFTFHGTGTYVIGHGDVAIVDPGPRDQAHIEALLQALDGETVRHILITHTHGDHSPASAAIADATGAPVLGYGPHPSHAGSEGSNTDDDDDDDQDDADQDASSASSCWSKPHMDAKLPSLAIDPESGAPPSLLEGLPPLEWLNLPPVAAAHMQTRREWLQHLLTDEVERASRAATTGEVSAFEAARGVCTAEPLPPKRAAAMMAATLHKFEEERAELVRCELIEIQALQALQAASGL